MSREECGAAFGYRPRRLLLVAALTLVTALDLLPGCSAQRTPSATTSPPAAPAAPLKMRIVRGFSEPLVPTKPTTADEDRDIAEATRSPDGAKAPLLAFLAAHPDSGWNAAIHVDLGVAYYREGFFSKAIAHYQAAWDAGRGATDVRAEALVDRAIGELAEMHARLGHVEELEAVLAAVAGRPIHGGATELIAAAKEGAWTMRHNPGVSFLCGPKALRNLLDVIHGTAGAASVVEAARSGEHGFTLAQLSELADKAGVPHRLIHRELGEPVPVPSIINWRLSHYAAIVGKTARGMYHVKDPTFGGGDMEIPEAAIDEEGSGYFLVPKPAGSEGEDLRLAWRDATPGEARTVYGMGFPQAFIQGLVTVCDKTTAIFFGAPDNALCNEIASVICTDCAAALGGGSGSQSSDVTTLGLGMAVPSAHAMEVSLNIKDIPIGFAPPVGPPVYIRLTYNQRESMDPNGPPANPIWFNVGPKWTLNVLSYVQDDPAGTIGLNVSRYAPGGGVVPSTSYVYNATTGKFAPEPQSGAILSFQQVNGSIQSYTLTGTDGSQLVYGFPDGASAQSTLRRFFLTQIIDPYGKSLQLNYETPGLPTTDAGFELPDAGFDAGSATVFPRLMTISDASGAMAMTFHYGSPTDPLLVTSIGDAFGRTATLQYENGHLSQIIDILNITSRFAYTKPGSPDFVTQLTTPYGPTTFDYGETDNANGPVTRWLETTDTLGATERLEFAEGLPLGVNTGIPRSDEQGANLPIPKLFPLPLTVAAGLLQYRNTFFWNKYVYPLASTLSGFDYTQAELVHWLHAYTPPSAPLMLAPSIESIRHPKENRIWYAYPGQVPNQDQSESVYEGVPGTFIAAPTTIARVLDDKSTQLTSIARNPLGKPTLITDPAGRKTRFAYDSNYTDLLKVEQLTATGWATLASYGTPYTNHLPPSYTDAAGGTWTYGYVPASGQLAQVTDPQQHKTLYNYETPSGGKLVSIMDGNGKTVLTFHYPTSCGIANPGHINCNLPDTVTDSAGATTGFTYDAFDRVTLVTYPDGSTDQRDCAFDPTENPDAQSVAEAGAPGQSLELRKHTDRNGHATVYDYDSERRLIKVTDPLEHTVKYDYYPIWLREYDQPPEDRHRRARADQDPELQRRRHAGRDRLFASAEPHAERDLRLRPVFPPPDHDDRWHGGHELRLLPNRGESRRCPRGCRRASARGAESRRGPVAVGHEPDPRLGQPCIRWRHAGERGNSRRRRCRRFRRGHRAADAQRHRGLWL